MGFFNKDKSSDQQAGAAPNDPTASLSGVLSQAARSGQTTTTGGEAPQVLDEHGPSEFGETVEIEGSLEGYGDVILRGSVTGSIHITGRLVITETGRARADVAAREVLNSGTVEGNILASDRVRVEASGIVQGNIDAPSIVIEDGGGVDGFVEMAPGGEVDQDEVKEFVPPPPIRGGRPSSTSDAPVVPSERTVVPPPNPAPPLGEPKVAVAQQAGGVEQPAPELAPPPSVSQAPIEGGSSEDSGDPGDDEDTGPTSAIFSKKPFQ